MFIVFLKKYGIAFTPVYLLNPKLNAKNSEKKIFCMQNKNI